MTTSQPHQSFSIRETLTSIIIAFALAFVFRAFVVEAFVIPTGSMAPTLMGAHMRFRSPQTGYDWAVDPWDKQGEKPRPVQGDVANPIRVNDAMSGYPMSEYGLRTHTGDRILVLKYLIPFGLRPTRFDAVVFKNPNEPQVNFIKRLIGLPGEQIALVDGDVFVRTPATTPDDPAIASAWAQPGWKIVRKWDSGDGMRSRRGLHLQTSVWQPVFSSEFAPLEPDLNPRIPRNRRFRPPWSGDGTGWDLSGASYRYSGSGATALRWDERVRPIVDRNAYNQASDEADSSKRDGWSTPLKPKQFPVSDVRLRCGVEPAGPGLTVAAIVETRGHVFRARFENDAVSIDLREPDGTWRDSVGAGTVQGLLAPGRVTSLEFWHVDQALHVLVDGRHIASATYGDDWSPEDRLEHATGKPIEAILGPSDPPTGKNPLAVPSLYERAGPVIRWEFSGGPFTLHRVGLDRDLFYRPATRRSGEPGWSTHPSTTRTLTATQYFACGDNSANSSDGRMWESVDPWVEQLDDRKGIVP